MKILVEPEALDVGRNARKLLDMGAAMMIYDGELSGESLSNAIRELYKDGTIRTEMQKHSRILGRPEASEKVVDIAMSLVKDRSGINRV